MSKHTSFRKAILFVFPVILQMTAASTVESTYNYGSSSDSQTLGHISELAELHSGIMEIPKGEKLQRHRRYITVNLEAQFNVGFLIVTPIIILLPSMTNLFNKWRRRRSSDIENEIIETYHDIPAVQHHLNKISTYFHLLELPESSCQIRAVCEFSAEPEKYYPLSDMILRRLRDPILPAFLSYGNDRMENGTQTSVNPKSLYRIYNSAADIGQAYGLNSCQQHYGNGCKYSMDKLLNMPVLRFWAGLSNLLRLSFTDDDNSSN